MSSNTIIGIDLGTTHSLVGVVDSGFPILLADENGNRILPSIIHFPERGDVLVGEPARRMAAVAPKLTFASIKRLVGRRFDQKARLRLPDQMMAGLQFRRTERRFYPKTFRQKFWQN